MLTIRDLAELDDQHMAISCDWAEGEGDEAFAAWLAAHEVQQLPREADAAIAAYNSNTAGDDDPVVIRDSAEASYGGGQEANHWYEALDGTVYVLSAFRDTYVIPAADVAVVPLIRNYRSTYSNA